MNEQERAWAGEHGNDYNRRSPGDEQANLALFQRVFCGYYGTIAGPAPADIAAGRILELGAGQGANLRALRTLFPKAHRTAVEINAQAVDVLHGTGSADDVIHASVLEWEPTPSHYQLVLTKGFLIHVHPEELPVAYEVIHRAAARWILLCEYYSPRVEVIPYRGAVDLLWKAPHAEDMLKRYPDLNLREYGFVSKLDHFPQDDITWWLIEKRVPAVNDASVAWPFPASAAR